MGHVLSDKTQLPPVSSQKKKWKQSELEMLKRQKYIDKVLYGPILNKNHGKKEHNNSPWIAPASSAAQVKDNSAEKSQTFTSEKTVNDDHYKDNTESVDPFAQDVASEAEKPKIDLGNMDSIFLFPLFPPPNSKDHGFGHFQTAEELAIPGVTDTMTRLPSVTSILSKTMSPEARFFLDRWEKEMIAELGEDGFAKYKKELFSNGSNFHSCIEKYLGGMPEEELDLSGANEGYWSSIQTVFPDVGEVVNTEQMVQHPQLHYKGIYDCVAKYRDQLCLIDWKTSKRQKADIRHTYDNPIQLAAYMGAVNFDPSLRLKIESTLLVIAYKDGSPAHVHLIPRQKCVHYWGLWLQRLHAYWRILATQQATNFSQ
ncbi:Mitochondrial genome maintenance exonuclease 1 [Lamellibrachia satsuma]|nr:Mitochondrial genome maintenance exonuclease 1 [Lamellibrachia satsuma]